MRRLVSLNRPPHRRAPRAGAATVAATLGFLVVASPAVCPAGTFTIAATDSGWYSDQGAHTASNQNYAVGWVNEEIRNFFVFDLSGIPSGETVTSATLRAYNPDLGEPTVASDGGYDSPDATETYQLRQVTTSASAVRAGGTGLTSIYTDLGDGAIFGSHVASAADNGTFVSIALNGAGIAAVDGAVGGTLVIGGHLTTLSKSSGVEEIFFAHTDPPGLGPYTRELIVVTERESDGECDFQICPDDVEVCTIGDFVEIVDLESECVYDEKGKIKIKDKNGILRVNAKARSSAEECGRRARIGVRYDPATGECVGKAKIKVAGTKRRLETPAPCECERAR